MPAAVCSVVECAEPRYVRGLCPRHYMRAWRAENAERQRAKQREYKRTNRERLNRLERERVSANIETHRAKNRARYATNKDAHRARQQRWDARNKPALVAKRQRRIARLKAAPGVLSTAAWRAILAVHPCCYYCGASGPLEQEHMTPLSRGGHHSPLNVVPACGPCNLSKHTLTAWEFSERVASAA